MIEGTLKYEFEPQEDITAYELASAMKNRLYTDGFIQSEVWTKLPEGIRRHFKITEVTYQNEEQGQVQINPTQGAQPAGAGKVHPNPNLLVPKAFPARTIPLGPGGVGGGNIKGGNVILDILSGTPVIEDPK